MGLIDIKKLNAEIDTMIANQKGEIAEMKEKYDETMEYRYTLMITAFKEFAAVANEIGMPIVVNMKNFDTDGSAACPHGVKFLQKTLCEIVWTNILGDSSDCALICFDSIYDKRVRYINDTINYWWDHAAGFRMTFEEKCIKAIKAKAEAANAEYSKAKENYGKTIEKGA